MDSSKIDSNRVGTSMVIFKKSHRAPSNHLCFFLGNTNQYTLYKAEAIGLLLAVWSIF